MTHEKPREEQPAGAPDTSERFLERWSRRKLAARDAESVPPPAPESSAPSPASPAPAGEQGKASADRAPAAEPAAPLPPVESLTFESDFRAFLQPHVAEDLKRQALKKLLRDPRFNVMDGLDVYIDDYSLPSPLPSEQLRRLAHARYIFDPPPTRVNAQGHVEDVPDDEGERIAASADGGGDADHSHPAAPPPAAAGLAAAAGSGGPDVPAAHAAVDVSRASEQGSTPLQSAGSECNADDQRPSDSRRNPTR